MPNEKTSQSLSDNDILTMIKEIITEKPTYGYHRVHTILNYKLAAQNQVNHKRIYRIMKQNNLLHFPYGNRPTRVHDGKIITLKINLRWCYDSFTITCDNGD